MDTHIGCLEAQKGGLEVYRSMVTDSHHSLTRSMIRIRVRIKVKRSWIRIQISIEMKSWGGLKDASVDLAASFPSAIGQADLNLICIEKKDLI